MIDAENGSATDQLGHTVATAPFLGVTGLPPALREGSVDLEIGIIRPDDPEICSADLVTETLAGTAALLQVRPSAAIREAVASPGGATEAGLEALERGGLEAALADAVRASLERFR